MNCTDNAKAVEILLKNGANPNARHKKLNWSVLQLAFLRSTFHIIQFSNNTQKHKVKCINKIVLGASRLSGEKIIDLLIENGADVKFKYPFRKIKNVN